MSAPALLGRRMAAEAAGTFFLVLMGPGAIVVNALTGGAVTPLGIALAFGLVILVMVASLGHLSGAHLNPAVTLAFWSSGHFPAADVLAYIVAQCAGAAGASLLTRAALGPAGHVGATLPTVSSGVAFGSGMFYATGGAGYADLRHRFFTTNTAKVFGQAVNGSVVKEIAANATTPGTYLAAGTVASATSTTTTLDSGAVATANRYVGDLLVITAGTGSGQDVVITAFNSSRVATHEAWVTVPDNTSTYQIRPGKSSATVTAGDAPTADENAAAVVAALAGSVPVNIISPFEPQHLDLFRGDQYVSGDGAGRTFSVTYQAGEPWPDTISSAKFTCKPTPETLDDYPSAASISGLDCVVDVSTGAGRKVTVNLSASNVATLQASLAGTNGYRWWIIANGSNSATLRSGTMTVRPDPTAA